MTERRTVDVPEEWANSLEYVYTVFGIDPIGDFGFLDNLKRTAQERAEQAKGQARDILGQFRKMGKQYTQDGKLIRARIGLDLKGWIRSNFNPQLVGGLDSEESIPHHLKEALKSIIKEFFYVPDPNERRSRGGGGGKVKKPKKPEEELTEEALEKAKKHFLEEAEWEEPDEDDDWERLNPEIDDEEDPGRRPKPDQNGKRPSRKYKSTDGWELEQGEDPEDPEKKVWILRNPQGELQGKFDTITEANEKREVVNGIKNLQTEIYRISKKYESESNPQIKKAIEIFQKGPNVKAEEIAKTAQDIAQYFIENEIEENEIGVLVDKDGKPITDAREAFDDIGSLLQKMSEVIQFAGKKKDRKMEERYNKAIDRVRGEAALKEANEKGIAWDKNTPHPEMSKVKNNIPGIEYEKDESIADKSLRSEALEADDNWRTARARREYIEDQVEILQNSLDQSPDMQPSPDDPDTDWRKERIDSFKKTQEQLAEYEETMRNQMIDMLERLADRKGIQADKRWWNSPPVNKKEKESKKKKDKELIPETQPLVEEGDERIRDSGSQGNGSSENPEQDKPQNDNAEPEAPEPEPTEPKSGSSDENEGSEEQEKEPENNRPAAPSQSTGEDGSKKEQTQEEKDDELYTSSASDVKRKLEEAQQEAQKIQNEINDITEKIDQLKKSKPKSGAKHKDVKEWTRKMQIMQGALERRGKRMKAAEATVQEHQKDIRTLLAGVRNKGSIPEELKGFLNA